MGSRSTTALSSRPWHAGTSGAQELKRESVDAESLVNSDSILVCAPHPATLDEAQLIRQCKFSTGRVSGPGGQHRNRVETAVFVTHAVTGIEAQGTERRSQIMNRSMAIHRLRVLLAILVRTRPGDRNLQPSALWLSRRRDRAIRVNIDHWDYPDILSEALDAVDTCSFDVAATAKTFGVSSSQLTRFIRTNKLAARRMNDSRTTHGLRPLRD